MEHTITVFYTFCPRNTELPGTYLQEQRKIADKILNYGVKKCFDIEFDKEKVVRGNHGKPYWSGEEPIWFNVSHTEGLVVCGIASQEIGVDAEGLREVRMPLIRRSCSKGEINYILNGKENLPERGKEVLGEVERERFSRIWTLKESYIKMTGDGMAFPLQEAEFSIEEKSNEKFSIKCSQPGYFVQKKIGDDWISVCGSQPAEVVWQELLV